MDTSNLIKSTCIALVEMLPGAIASAAHEVSGLFDATPEECAYLEKATQSRRDEFLTGRYCLRQALAKLGHTDSTLLPDEDGVPILPTGTLGSISHSRGLCLAVATGTTDHIYLGIDVEKTTRLSKLAIKRVVHPGEASWVDENQLKASILFSAKEAFYKAQYPKWRCLGNFHDLALNVEESAQQATVLSISEQFPAELGTQADQFKFHYRLVEDYVVTLCYR
ncbi:MAG: 4'-phosphopantetheinyl transferase family protein [Lentimonas sp.]